jgi:hypothetical protein
MPGNEQWNFPMGRGLLSSVIVSWRGRCRSREKQEELCKFISQLANACRGFYEKPPKVKYFDERIRR